MGEESTARLASLPPAPDNPLPLAQRVRAPRSLHTGSEQPRDADFHIWPQVRHRGYVGAHR